MAVGTLPAPPRNGEGTLGNSIVPLHTDRSVKLTSVWSVNAPTVAVTIFCSALVDESVAEKRPAPLVDPLAGVRELLLPLTDSETACDETVLPLASATSTDSVDFVVPLAARVV